MDPYSLSSGSCFWWLEGCTEGTVVLYGYVVFSIRLSIASTFSHFCIIQGSTSSTFSPAPTFSSVLFLVCGFGLHFSRAESGYRFSASVVPWSITFWRNILPIQVLSIFKFSYLNFLLSGSLHILHINCLGNMELQTFSPVHRLPFIVGCSLHLSKGVSAVWLCLPWQCFCCHDPKITII